MIIKGKKFNFYVPDITALDVLKGIFAFINRDKSYTCNPTKYNFFFQKAAKKYPNMFEDISFEEDDFLPYSEDFEKAYTSAAEFKIINRPNPDIYPCKVVASEERLKKHLMKFTPEQITIIEGLAKEFEKELQE